MRVDNLLNLVIRDMEDNVYNFTKDGKCSGCGGCCSNLLPMSDKEIKKIHKYIKKHNIEECKHLLPVAKECMDMTCPFLDTDKKKDKCRIYEVRPMICRKFICDNKQRARLTRDQINQTRQIVDVREEFYGK